MRLRDAPRPARAGASDDEAIRRAARRVALQTSVVFAAALVGLAVLAAALMLRTQQSGDERLLRQAIADSDAVTDPPSGIYIYESDRGTTRVSTGLPGGGPLDPAGFAAVAAGRDAPAREVTRDGRVFLVDTGHRGTTTVQAALDLSEQHRARDQLMRSLAQAGVVGIVVAAGVGWVIARRAIRPLGTALERQRRFVADASHELRTPLTQVHTRAQLLRTSLADLDRPEVAEDLDRLVAGTRNLGDIVDELLISAQLRGQPGAAPDDVDLATVATEAVAAEQPRARELLVSLTASTDAGPHVVAGSATALRRVVTSLVDNALGHVRPGGHITVDVQRLADPLRVVCRVRDDGIGFDDDEAERLFDRFARGQHGRGRRHGIGLALVREVVEAHGGTVTAEGAPGSGATFTVSLPADRGHAG